MESDTIEIIIIGSAFRLWVKIRGEVRHIKDGEFTARKTGVSLAAKRIIQLLKAVKSLGKIIIIVAPVLREKC